MSRNGKPGRLKTWLRRLRTLLWTALTLLTLLAAVIVGIGKLLMPYSAEYKPQLEAWLSKEFNQPVQVDAFTGEWKAFGPRISLEGLNLLGEPGSEAQIAIQHAALDVKPLNALIAGRPLYSFRIIGADLVLVRGVDGRFALSGLGVSGRGADGGAGFSNLGRVGEVRLDDSSLSYSDQGRGIELQLTDLGGRLQIAGRRLALDVQASISDPLRARVLGDLGATVLLRLGEDRRLEAAEWHVETGELMLSEVVARLPRHDLTPQGGWLNAELWGSWSPDSPQRMQGVLDIRDAKLPADSGLLQLERLNARFRWRFSDRRSWRVDLADVRVREGGRDWRNPRLSVERNLSGNLGVWVSADFLEAEFPLALTQRIMKGFNARWPRNMPTAGRGVIRDFDLLIDGEKLFAGASGRFENLEVLDWGRWPRLGRVEGSVDLLLGEGSATLRGEQIRFDWPRNFRAPLIADIPACDLDILWFRRDWQIDVRDCALENEFIAVNGRLRFRRDEDRPQVAIDAAAERADLAALAPYWPASIMKPRVIEWLGRSLVQGQARDVRFSMHGDIDDFPFREREGSFEARFDFEDSVIAYQPGWPAARGSSGNAQFIGPAMRVEGRIADLGGAPVARVSAGIGDFRRARLELDYRTTARLSDVAAFLDATPLLNDSEISLDRFAFQGEAPLRGRLVVPLGTTPGELELSGRIELEEDHFEERISGTRLESLAGTLEYDRGGFRGEALTTTYGGWPAQLDLAAAWAEEEPFRARLTGHFPASLVIGVSPLVNDPLLARINGESDWTAMLTVSRPDAVDSEAEIWLDLESDLVGTTVGLPLPLQKPPQARWPLRVRYPVKSAAPEILARLDGRLEIRAERREDDAGEPVGLRRMSIQLGPGEAEMTPPGYFALHGEAEQVDFDNWLRTLTDYFATVREAENLALSEVEFRAGELLMLNRSFADVAVSIDNPDGVLQTFFDGEDIAGQVRYHQSVGSAHSLNAEMQRLYLPRTTVGGPFGEIDPSLLPELHLFIDHLRYGDIDLGETRVEAFPVADGLRFDSVNCTTELLDFQARGDWLASADGSRSDFDIVMTAESLGALVDTLKLSSVLQGGQTMVRYNAWWPGPPAAFSLARLNGEMTFSVVDGNILNANPGAGRLLGLISVTALPRRLAFDFRDVFESGFSFDQASATVRLESGIAHTDDFVLESTTASLKIEGTSDLVNQQFDYRLTVRPGVSQALPVIGAIAGGPTGAAAGLALQGLLRDALGEAAEARYSIRGPWADPEVTRLEVPVQPADPVAQQQNPQPTESNDE